MLINIQLQNGNFFRVYCTIDTNFKASYALRVRFSSEIVLAEWYIDTLMVFHNYLILIKIMKGDRVEWRYVFGNFMKKRRNSFVLR